MLIVLGPSPASGGAAAPPDEWSAVVVPDGEGAPEPAVRFRRAQAPDVVRGLPARLGAEAAQVRWVLASVAEAYAPWIAAGVHVDRCWDLGLVQRILTRAASAPGSGVGPTGGSGGAGYRPVCE
ncbi:hypothetical protein NJC10_10390, partial [Micrococcus sp. M4NT]|nr:hypothetical protein [Micrococcus sp. M4NT]